MGNTIRNWKTSSPAALSSSSTSSSSSLPSMSMLTPKKSPKMEAIDGGKEELDDATGRLLEFCRLANLSVAQNTKSRANHGFKDNAGNYHPMCRYGISQILKLFCPAGVERLRCCGRVYELSSLKNHVVKVHHDSKSRLEPSISPL